VGAVAALLGIAAALFFAVAPVHMTVLRREPVQVAGGEFNLTLAPTGQTASIPTRVTCLPIQGYLLPQQEPDRACLARDVRRAHVALGALAVFVAGAVVWQLAGGGRSVLAASSGGTSPGHG
jgi:hypothetical protein